MNQNIQLMAYKQKHDSNKEDGKWSHCCVSCSAAPHREDHPLIGLTVPSSQTQTAQPCCFPHILILLRSPAQCLFSGASI